MAKPYRYDQYYCPMACQRVCMAYVLRRAHRYALAHGQPGTLGVQRYCLRIALGAGKRYAGLPHQRSVWWWHAAYNAACNLQSRGVAC